MWFVLEFGNLDITRYKLEPEIVFNIQPILFSFIELFRFEQKQYTKFSPTRIIKEYQRLGVANDVVPKVTRYEW